MSILTYKDNNIFLNTIIDAINHDNLILFVGSGISKLYGLPLWKELAYSLLKKCAEDPKCSSFSFEDLDDILKCIDDERELISIAKNIFKEAYGSDDEFYRLFNNELTLSNEKYDSSNLEIQRILFDFAETIITTNADRILDEGLNSENVIYKIEDFDRYKIDGVHKVIHIHGSLNDFETLVFTTSDYLNRYSNEKFRRTIANIFSTNSPYVILFIGYGFREMQLLDFLVNVDSREIRERKTFCLNGYFSNQENIFKVERDYYKEYGVTLVAFYKDDKNYRGLIDALQYIDNEAKAKSLSYSKRINKLINLINNKPNEERIRVLENEYDIQNEALKICILENVSKSKFNKEWTKSLVLNPKLSKKIFDSKTIVGDNIANKMLSDVLFPGLSLLANIDVFSSKTKSFFVRFIKELINEYFNNKELFLSLIVCKNFLKLIFTRKEFIKNKELRKFIFTFLDLFVINSPEPDIWMLFASFKNNSLTIKSQKIAESILNLVVKTLSKLNNIITYDFIQFFNSYSDFYCSRYRIVVIKKFLSKAEELFPSHYYSRDVVSVEIEKKNDREDAYSFVIKWLSKAIINLNSDETIKLFNKLILSQNKLKILLAIYTANVHFCILRKHFFDNLKLLDEKIYFSEIYSLLQNNVSSLTIEEVNQIVSFTEKINFNSQLLSFICKFHTLNILPKNFPNDTNLLEKINNLNSQIVSCYGKGLESQIDPLDMSKDIYISTKRDRVDNKKLKDKFLEMSFDDFIQYLKGFDPSTSEYEMYEISNIFDEIQLKFDLYNPKVLSSLNGLPNVFYDIMENHIGHSKLRLSAKFDLLKTIEQHKTTQKSNNTFLSSLYFEISNVRYIESNLCKSIFEYVKDIKIDLSTGKNDRYNESQNLVSNSCFLKYSILIMTCKSDYFEKLISIINVESKENINYVNAAISSKVHILWKLNSCWVITNIKSIFNHTIEEKNLSFYAFAFSQFHEAGFIECLFNANLLEPLLSSKDFDNVGWQYAYFILCNYLYLGKNKNALKIISKTSYYHNSFSLLLSYIKSTNKYKFNNKNFDYILSVLKANGIPNDGIYNMGIKILEFLNKGEVNDTRLEFISFAFSFKNSSFKCDKLADILGKKNFGEEINNTVSKTFLVYLTDCFFNEDGICKLFNFVDEGNKAEVMNLLGNKNPQLWVKLK